MTKPAKHYYKASKSPWLRPLLSNVYCALASHWLFQSMLAMDHSERAFKITTDVLFTVLFYLVLSRWLLLAPAICLAFILAHTINLLLNGHIYAVVKSFGYVQTDKSVFDAYLSSLRGRIQHEPSLRWAAAYGSVARGELSATSDLDVRVIRFPGFVNGIRACIFVCRERTQAHLRRFPLDILLLDSPRLLSRLRPDEPPLVIYDAAAMKRQDVHA
ncbi:MAG: nucleotidyltransferase domain-containing protein [Chloroflexi bacterium]|nr:nucleotidyltransferase domain-containing protein [Chloroflexota bacterium]